MTTTRRGCQRGLAEIGVSASCNCNSSMTDCASKGVVALSARTPAAAIASDRMMSAKGIRTMGMSACHSSIVLNFRGTCRAPACVDDDQAALPPATFVRFLAGGDLAPPFAALSSRVAAFGLAPDPPAPLAFARALAAGLAAVPALDRVLALPAAFVFGFGLVLVLVLVLVRLPVPAFAFAAAFLPLLAPDFAPAGALSRRPRLAAPAPSTWSRISSKVSRRHCS